VLLGASIMAGGHLMMAFESTFYVALATIATGAGLLLPNLPSQIDGLYAPADPRRDLAFNVYYVGINVGGVLAPFACGTIGELYGWHWGFTIAAAGMVAGLIIYLCGTPYLPPDTTNRASRVGRRDTSSGIGELRSYKLLLGLALIVTVLRGSYEQVGNTIAVWAENGIDRTVLEHFTIPMTWFQSLNPLLVFSLTPLLLAHWKRQAHRGNAISSLMKMARGAGLIACAYLLLALVALWSEHSGNTVSWAWLVLFFVILTAGELYVFPIGLALFARIGPARFVATSIAIWYLAGFAGNLLGGSFGTLWTVLSRAEFFAAMGGVALLAAGLFLTVQYRALVPAELVPAE
jgi:POT family proton-dependent oligopeptide transporter